MPTIEEALQKYNEAINASIFANPDFNRKTKGREGANASGNFASFISSKTVKVNTSLIVADGKTVFTKYGTDYTTAIDKGQPPGVRAGLEADLYEWLVYEKYNLTWETDAQRHAIAKYLTAKIQAKGTLKYRDPSFRTTIVQDALDDAYPVLLEQLELASVSAVDAKIKQSINGNPNI